MSGSLLLPLPWSLNTEGNCNQIDTYTSGFAVYILTFSYV